MDNTGINNLVIQLTELIKQASSLIQQIQDVGGISTPARVQVQQMDSQQIPSTSATSNEASQETVQQSNSSSIIQMGAGNKRQYVTVLSEKVGFSSKFKVSSKNVIFKLNEPTDNFTITEWFDKCFQNILDIVKTSNSTDDLMGIQILIPSVENTRPIGLPFKKLSNITSQMVTDLLSSVIQSNQSFQSTDLIEISVKIIQVYTGKGRLDISHMTDNEILKRKRNSIININNKSNANCLPQSIIIGKYLADNSNELLKKCLRINSKLLKQEVKKLLKKANINKTDNGYNIEDIFKFQKILPNYCITVYNNRADSTKILRLPGKGIKNINLFYFEKSKHYVTLKNVKSFYGKQYECNFCNKLYSSTHMCKEICKYCRINLPCNFVSTVCKCSECKRSFRGVQCLENHKKKKYGNGVVCDMIKICEKCFKFYDLTRRNYKPHCCDEKYCGVCSKLVDKSHECFIERYTKKRPEKFTIIFYDIECTQDMNKVSNSYVHVPNLCVANRVCHFCYSVDDDNFQCQNCEQRVYVFENDSDSNCLNKFIDFLLSINANINNKICCIAHNFKSYDSQFIVLELLKRNKIIKPIMGGFKILKITFDKYISFIDSLNFLPMPLAKFPKTFGFEGISKGDYPHYFNTNQNYNYIGDIPDINLFVTQNLNLNELEKFQKWWQDLKNSGYVFNNRNELIKYCQGDVRILRKGCLQFMTDFISLLNLNPFLESFTIAQAVMLVYRKNFLKENTLGITPSNNYSAKQNQSFIGQKWLLYENEKVKGAIKYEVVLPNCNIQVDGYISLTNTIYEFLGCFYHGCCKCFYDRSTLHNGLSFDNKYLNHLARLEYLKEKKYIVKTIWECEFKEVLKKNVILDKALNNDPLILYNGLQPREAVFGGRTEVFKLYCKTKTGDKIRYLDFTSLYPFVNKNCKYPIGHPKIYNRAQCKNILDITQIDGIIKCKILPPTDLLIPVLPTRINQKLMFVLCRTCGETENVTTSCTHDNDERSLVGTWADVEIKLSLEKGYKILELFEVWEYETTIYDPVSKSGGLFAEYMNTFIKLKQEASGFPNNCNTLEKKDNFIEEYYKIENVLLDKEKVIPNPSYRNTAKLCLNSLWGKMIQKNETIQTSVISSIDEFNKLVHSPGIEIEDLFIAGKDQIWLKWKYIHSECITPLRHVSITVGIYTTAHARVMLYKELDKIGKNLLYCDTDSIIFVENKDSLYKPITGNFLGEFTDELADHGPRTFITEFVTTGPKCYSYKYFNPESNLRGEVAKCKGVTCNLTNKKILNFNNLKKIIMDPMSTQTYIIHDAKKIKRKKHFVVVTESESKKFGFTFTKRVCVGDAFDTIPYGSQFPLV